jgi:hypothetical protein
MPNTARHAPRSATFALAALCVLTAAGAPPAGAQPKPPAADWPARSNSATAGSFAVVQVATDDTARFMAELAKPTPGVNLQVTTRVRRNRPIDTFIAFRGCRADRAGKCNVTARYDLRAPSGKISSFPGLDVWANQPQPAPGIIMVSRQSFGMTFNTDDAVGTYTVAAAVTDHVAGVTLHTQQDITVTK